MHNSTMRCAAALLIVLIACALCLLGGEQIEKLGPQLIADGSFISGDGREPVRPAGWTIDERGGGTVRWIEQGHLDKGGAKLTCDSDGGIASMQQRRWLSSAAPCYLASFSVKGSGNLTVRFRLFSESEPDLSSVVHSISNQPGWTANRIYFEPFPDGIEGELEVLFLLEGKGSYELDNVSLSKYEGPYTQQPQEFNAHLETRPADGAQVDGAVVLSWRAVPFAKEYKITVLEGKNEIKLTRKLPCCVLPVRKGDYFWGVTAVAADGAEFNVVQSSSFSAKADGILKPQAQISNLPPPGDSQDYADWRKSGIARELVSLLSGMDVPTLPEPKVRDGAIPPSALYEFNCIRQDYADLIVRYSTLASCGEKALDLRLANLINSIATDITNNEQFYLPDTRAYIAFAACSASVARSDLKASCGSIVFRALGDAAKLAASACQKADNFNLYRNLAAAFLCTRFGLIGGDALQFAEAFAALSERWIGDRQNRLPISVFVSDYPLLRAAAYELDNTLQIPAAKRFKDNLNCVGHAIISGFPRDSRSPFGDSTSNADAKARAVLSYLCSRDTTLPVWANTGNIAQYAGWMGLMPSSKASIGAISQFVAAHDIAMYGSAYLSGETAFGVRASSLGTVTPFAATQGHFYLWWNNQPLIGLVPDAAHGLPTTSASVWRAPQFRCMPWSGPLSAFSPSSSCDAQITESFSSKCGALVACNLTATAIDTWRDYRRFIAFVAPPNHPPIVAVYDRYSAWFKTQPTLYFRLLGEPSVDPITQRSIADCGGVKTECVVVWPKGCGVGSDKAIAVAPLSKVPESSFALSVSPPTDANECAVVFAPRITAENALTSLQGDDFRGVAIGENGVVAFRSTAGGAYIVNGVMTDAQFVAVIPYADGSAFAFIANAKTLDISGLNIFSSEKPITGTFLYSTGTPAKLIECDIAPLLGVEVKDLTATLLGDISYKLKDGFSLVQPVKHASPRIKKSLFIDDSIDMPIQEPVFGNRLLVAVPMKLNGLYRVSAELSGEKGKTAGIGLAGKDELVLLADGKPKNVVFEQRFFGISCLTALLDSGVKLGSISVEKLYLQNGGLEEWIADSPVGFNFEPSNLKPTKDADVKVSGSFSALFKLPANSKVAMRTTVQSGGKPFSVSASIRLQSPDEKDLNATIVCVALDAAGKPIGGEVATTPFGSQRVWRKLKLTVKPVKGAASYQIEFRFSGQGSAWIDEISVDE